MSKQAPWRLILSVSEGTTKRIYAQNARRTLSAYYVLTGVGNNFPSRAWALAWGRVASPRMSRCGMDVPPTVPSMSHPTGFARLHSPPGFSASCLLSRILHDFVQNAMDRRT